MLNTKSGISRADDIEGEKNKRLDPKFKALETSCPEIANKQFLYKASLAPSLLLKNGLSDHILEYWMAALPLRNFLASAISSADQT